MREPSIIFDAYDNAAVETFFKAIKAELIWPGSWEMRRQAETAFGHSIGPIAEMPLLQYINRFITQAVGIQHWKEKPSAFERQLA